MPWKGDHRGEGRDAFQVNLAKQVFHGFSCGAGGTVLDLVASGSGRERREKDRVG